MKALARKQPGLLFDDDEPPHGADRRTVAEREAHLNQIIAELTRAPDGVSGLRLAEISPDWRGDLRCLEARGRAFHITEIERRFAIVHLVN